MKLKVSIEEVAVGLVNRKNRVFFGEVNLKKFNLNFGLSSRKMVLNGSLAEMCYADYSAYPYTIYQEQSEYSKKDFIVKAIDSERDMVEFDIQML